MDLSKQFNTPRPSPLLYGCRTVSLRLRDENFRTNLACSDTRNVFVLPGCVLPGRAAAFTSSTAAQKVQGWNVLVTVVREVFLTAPPQRLIFIESDLAIRRTVYPRSWRVVSVRHLGQEVGCGRSQKLPFDCPPSLSINLFVHCALCFRIQAACQSFSIFDSELLHCAKMDQKAQCQEEGRLLPLCLKPVRGSAN